MNWLYLIPSLVAALGLLAYCAGVYPTRRMIVVALAPTALSLAPLIQAGVPPWPIYLVDALLLVAAIVDFITLPSKKRFAMTRETGRIASLGKLHEATLTLVSSLARRRRVRIRDDVPAEIDATPEEFDLVLDGRSRNLVRYQMTPRKRGAFEMEYVYLKVDGRLGLWQKHFQYRVASTINVYPDMKQLAEYAVLARTNRLSLLGVRRTRKIGQDNEFERLRDYTPDDNYKHIDWRSTARRNRLTVKDFQANQSQRIMFLVDCGRMMTNEVDGASLLDHALNSMLMLSFVALRQGDSVGFMAFSNEIHRYVPPRSGMSQMNRLLHASFNQFPRFVESRYDQAFLYLGSHCRKRALVVLATNVIDEVNSLQIHRYLSNLVGKHLPLGILMRDHRLFDPLEAHQPQGAALFEAGAAADILNWRQQVIADLQSRGVLSLDVFPEDMTAPLVNRYLEIKARHLL